MNALISSAPAPLQPGGSAHLGAGSTSMPANRLMGAQPGGASPPPPPPPPASMPVPMPPPNMPAMPPGAAMSTRAVQHLKALQLTPQQVGTERDRSEYLIQLLAPLARKPGPVSAKELVAAAADAVATGHASPAEVGAFLANLPVDKGRLKALVQQHLHTHILLAVHLRGMEGGKPSASSISGGGM